MVQCCCLEVDGCSVVTQTSLHHQLLEVLELCLHLRELLFEARVLLLQLPHLLLHHVLLAFHLLTVPEGCCSVLSLLPLLLIRGVGSNRSFGWLGASILLPGLGS